MCKYIKSYLNQKIKMFMIQFVSAYQHEHDCLESIKILTDSNFEIVHASINNSILSWTRVPEIKKNHLAHIFK